MCGARAEFSAWGEGHFGIEAEVEIRGQIMFALEAVPLGLLGIAGQLETGRAFPCLPALQVLHGKAQHGGEQARILGIDLAESDGVGQLHEPDLYRVQIFEQGQLSAGG